MQCFQPKEGFSYEFRPSHVCDLKGRDYDIRIRSNALGLRDDDDSLVQPAIILLGDSQVWGIGVPQEHTIEAELERISKKKVLNAGMVAYGTVRQLRLLAELDRSQLEYVVIVFNSYQTKENARFVQQGNTLGSLSARDYRIVIENHKRAEKKASHVFMAPHFSKILWARVWQGAPRLTKQRMKKQARKEVAHFLSVLRAHNEQLSGMKVLITQANFSTEPSPYFMQILQKKLLSEQFSFHVRLLDTNELWQADDFLRLDKHLSRQGTRTLAEAIARELHMEETPGKLVFLQHIKSLLFNNTEQAKSRVVRLCSAAFPFVDG